MMMNRVYSIAADEVPKFENLRQTKSGSMEPIELFLVKCSRKHTIRPRYKQYDDKFKNLGKEIEDLAN